VQDERTDFNCAHPGLPLRRYDVSKPRNGSLMVPMAQQVVGRTLDPMIFTRRPPSARIRTPVSALVYAASDGENSMSEGMCCSRW